MAEPFSIQRVPGGLLELIGAKGTGENPRNLIPAVQPDIALEPYYLAGRIELVQNQGNLLTTAGQSTSVTVDQGQYWRVVTYGVRVHTPSAVNAVMHGGIGLSPSLSGTPATITQLTRRHVATGGDLIGIGELVSYPLVLGPGDRITAFLAENVGGALTVSLQVVALIVRL